MSKTISIDDLNRKIISTENGEWFKVDIGMFFNEFGVYCPIDTSKIRIKEIRDSWPILMENDSFRLFSRYRRSFLPTEPLLFQKADGFRFRVNLSNYRLTIPFWFVVNDGRVKIAESEWGCPVGKLLHILVDKELSISFTENKPSLTIDGVCGRMIVKSQ